MSLSRSLLPFFIYLALSFGLFGQLHGWQSKYFGRGADPICFIWFMDWFPYALRHGLNPFVTKYLWFPEGYNLAWTTSVPTLALLSVPATLLFGAGLSFNLLSITAPALAGWTAFLLARVLTRDYWAAVFGGFMFGFSSYEMGQLLGHLNLDFVCLVPLAVLLVVLRVRQEMAQRWFIGGMALLLLAQLGISTEILATLVSFGAFALLVFIGFAPQESRSVLWRTAREIYAAGLCAAAVGAPWLFYVAKGAGTVAGGQLLATIYATNSANFIIPTTVNWAAGARFLGWSSKFAGNPSEQGAYLGLPLVLLAVLYFWRARGPAVRALLVVIVALAVFSCGPGLHILHTSTGIPLPWWLGCRLPLLGAALPSRFTMYVALGMAVVTSCYLARPGRWRPLRFGLAAVAGLALLPNPRLYGWTQWSEPALFSARPLDAALLGHPNVLALPYIFGSNALAWQINSGMAFTLGAAYAGPAPPLDRSFPVLAELITSVPGPQFGNEFTDFCASHGVTEILIGPGTVPAITQAIEALGWPRRTAGGMEIVQVPARPRYFALLGDHWPSSAAAMWMGGKLTIVAHAAPVTVTLSGALTPLTRVDVTVTSGVGQSVLVVPGAPAGAAAVTFVVPADTAAVLTADQTFVPVKPHGTKKHGLSVLVAVTQ